MAALRPSLEEHPLLPSPHPSNSMATNSRRGSQALEDEERGNGYDAPSTEKVDGIPLTTRPSRSPSSRSSRPSESSAHRDAAANGSPSEPSIGLRDAVVGTVRTRNKSPAKRWLARVRGKGRKKIGWKESLRAIALSSCKCFSPLSYHDILAAAATSSLLQRQRDARRET